jgi:hypothetical protein
LRLRKGRGPTAGRPSPRESRAAGSPRFLSPPERIAIADLLTRGEGIRAIARDLGPNSRVDDQSSTSAAVGGLMRFTCAGRVGQSSGGILIAFGVPVGPGLWQYLGPRVATACLSCSPRSSSRSVSTFSTAALIAAIRVPSGAEGCGDDEGAGEGGCAVEGELAGADVGEFGEELADGVGVLGAGEVEEAVHLVVGEVGEQGLAGGAV